MTNTRLTDEQILDLLLQAHDGQPVAIVCEQYGVTPQTFYSWRHKYATRVLDRLTNRRAAVESENERLKAEAHDGELREVTVLLSDLRGFTSLSERCTPQQIVKLLNRYFALMTRIILDHGGTIDKFMGDAIMVLFGAPLYRSDDAMQAIACAIEMEMAMEAFNRESAAEGLDPLYMGIGINTGPVIAGHLGSPLHSEYTVIGDDVNLASRIEAHTLRGQILISEKTYALTQSAIEVGLINEISVKGKQAPVRMYELLGTREPRVLKVPRRDGRCSPRVPVNMPMRYQVIDDKTVLPDEHIGTIDDLSYGGLRMTSATPLIALTEIRILQLQSLITPEIVSIYARVRRLSGAGGSVSYHLEFTSIDPESCRAIKEYVDTLVQRR
jgi:adenylate cyclase